MRSVYNEEMDIIWNKYKKRIDNIGYLNFLEDEDEVLQQYLKFSFKELLEAVKTRGAIFGLERKKINYSILKLRRLIALWKNKDVMCGNFEVTYKDDDKYMNFPMFDRQNYDIMPTVNTIHKIKVKLLDKLIEDYNNYVDDTKAKRPDLKYITNLRELRMFLIVKCEIEPKKATNLTNIYKAGAAKKEVWDFSDNLEKI